MESGRAVAGSGRVVAVERLSLSFFKHSQYDHFPNFLSAAVWTLESSRIHFTPDADETRQFCRVWPGGVN